MSTDDYERSPSRPGTSGGENKMNTQVPADGDAQKRKATSPAPANVDDRDQPRSPKRSKLDESAPAEDLPGATTAPKEPAAERRGAPSQEERKQEERRRGKRLFGGLLSTLSQTTSSSQHRRRQEIERRQQAKVHQQEAEDDKHRQEKLAKLEAVRKAEQIKFDEQVMRTRHSNMLAAAQYLQTRSHPKIHYSPWNRTAGQADTIKKQIREAEDTIEREISDFKSRKQQRLKALGLVVEQSSPEPEAKPVPDIEQEQEPERMETAGKVDDHEDRPTDTPLAGSTNRAPSHSSKTGLEKESDESGDVMVEDAEDTVIY